MTRNKAASVVLVRADQLDFKDPKNISRRIGSVDKFTRTVRSSLIYNLPVLPLIFRMPQWAVFSASF